MVKKVLLWMLACACVFWSCRIYSINRVKEDIRYYTMQDSVDVDGVRIEPREAQLYTIEEFGGRFGISVDDLRAMDNNMSEGKIICACFRFTNDTDADISWDTLLDNACEGFETTAWCSVITPGLGAYMNVFQSETFGVGDVQDIWFATTVSKECFKPRNWQHIKEYPFYYVLSLKPEKIKINLDIGEGAL